MHQSAKKYQDLTVLTVDDSVFARSLYRSMVAHLGIANIGEAGDGARAIEMLAAHQYDLMLLDWVMPTMSGRRTLKYIRRPEFAPMCTIPIIVVTGQANRINCIRAAEFGADTIMAKPFSINTLVERIDCVLSPHRQVVRTDDYMGPNWFDPTRLSDHLDDQSDWEAARNSPILANELQRIPGRENTTNPAPMTKMTAPATASNVGDDSGVMLDI
jgi:two-component system chemotaxis response regulator CheY